MAKNDCTDIYWLYSFIIFWIILIVMAVFSIIYGNYLPIINGYDSFGNICGIRHNKHYENFPLSGMDTSNKSFLFLFDSRDINNTLRICTEKCVKDDSFSPYSLYSHFSIGKVQLCRYDFQMDFLTSKFDNAHYDKLGPCPPLPIFRTYPYKNRCVAEGSIKFSRKMYYIFNSTNVAQQFFIEIYSTWHCIVITSGLALFISTILVVMMSRMVRFVSWSICTLVIITSGSVSGLLWYIFYNIPSETDEDDELYDDLPDDVELPHYFLMKDFVRNKEAIFILAIFSTITTVALITKVFLFRKNLIGFGVIFKEAANCMFTLSGLMIAPAFALLELTGFLIFWSYIVIYMVTVHYAEFMPFVQNSNAEIVTDASQIIYQSTQKVEYVEVEWIRGLLWIHIVGLVWTTEFIYACEEFYLGAAVAHWYFKRPTYSIGKLPKYHLGTVAKGSFLITLFMVPRFILVHLYTKSKATGGTGYSCAQCYRKCKLKLFEKFLRAVNHNAYTIAAMESIDFIPAAKNAKKIMTSEELQVEAINNMTTFVFFSTKLIVAIVICTITIIFLRGRPDLNFYIAPVIICTVFSFFIAHIVVSLFEMTVDTLLLCFCEDKAINRTGGRWKRSNLAKLLCEEQERGHIQVIKIKSNRPFCIDVPN